MHYKHYSSDGWLPEGLGEHLILVRIEEVSNIYAISMAIL